MSGSNDTEMAPEAKIVRHMSFEIIGKDDVWSTFDDGELKGLRIGIGPGGVIVSLSSRHSKDGTRWLKIMPSLELYPSLKELDLHKNRYIQTLHDSVCNLLQLETLKLTQCESLTTLPSEIGRLTDLREVSKIRKVSNVSLHVVQSLRTWVTRPAEHKPEFSKGSHPVLRVLWSVPVFKLILSSVVR
jgi:Leucine-rich repeat (LRR) protein